MAAEIVIREITGPAEFAESARVIRSSFRTVVKEFGLNRKNAPTHPGFLTVSRIKEMKSRGAKCFGQFLGKKQIGFIAVQKTDESIYEIERLAVLPSRRHGGCGAELVKFSVDYIREQQGKKVTLGMINESTVLKNWYIGLGFKEISVRRFPHLPFTVCFMERDIKPLDL